MKLKDVWISATAWNVLSKLKKGPKLSYRLLKYQKKINAELEAINSERERILYAAAGVEPPTPPDVLLVQIEPKCEADDGEGGKKIVDNPKYAEYVKNFNELLEGQCDLEWFGLSMEELVDALDAALPAPNGNTLSENDIELLEPFFTEPKKTELSVVK